MAQDPAFLFYPADVAEDTLMMNRLQRGCYFDLLKAQKRFEQFTLEQIKDMLGSDFEACWMALKPVLKQDGPHYYINWVREAIKKRKDYTLSRRINKAGKKTYEEDTTNISDNICNNISLTHEKDMSNICSSCDEHMENGNVIENINKTEVENKEGEGGKNLSHLPFPTLQFAEAWQRWLDYHAKVIKKPYKQPENLLKKLSVFDEAFCIDLIDRAIANEHQGLVFVNTLSDFLKYQKNGQKQNTGKHTAINGSEYNGESRPFGSFL